MALRFGEEINDIPEEADRPWYRPAAEFAVMMVILFLILGGVTARAATRSFVISEQAKSYAGEDVPREDVITDWFVMKMGEIPGKTGFSIPLPLTVRPENISVENYYQDHTLFIRIKGVHAENFDGASIGGDISHLITAAFREYAGEVRISLMMDGVWDHDISQENSQLVVTPYKAKDRYDHTVVLVTELPEKNSTGAAGEVAELASDLTEHTRLYVAEYRSDEEVLGFLEETGAEAVVFIETSASTERGKYGMSAEYNGHYFNPGLDNATFAEALLRNIAVSASGRALSLKEPEEENLLDMIEIPAARIYIGYVSNPPEKECLENPTYQKALAEGIVNAIEEVIEK